MTDSEQSQHQGGLQTEKFNYSLLAMQNERAEAEQNFLSGKETPLRLARIDKRIALFQAEHDDTGALKGEHLGKKLHQYFERRGWRVDEKGHLSITDFDQKTALGMATIVELSRLNAEAGHIASDKAMSTTVMGIEASIRDVLGSHPDAEEARTSDGYVIPEHYDIFHTRGADFAFIVNGDVLEDKAGDTISTQVAETVRGFKAVTENKKIEGSPIGVVRTTLADAIAMFNTYQDRLDALGFARVEGDDIKRTVVDLWKRTAEAALEEEFVLTLGNRYLDMVMAGGDQGKADKYFQNYVQKFFTGTDMADPASFHPRGDNEDARNIDRTRIEETMLHIVQQRTLGILTNEKQGIRPENQALLDVIAEHRIQTGSEITPVAIEIKSEDEPRMAYMREHTVTPESLDTYRAQTERRTLLDTRAAFFEEHTMLIERLIKTSDNPSEEDLVTLEEMITLANYPESTKAGEKEISREEMIATAKELISKFRSHTATYVDASRLSEILATAKDEHSLQENRVDQLTGLPNRKEYYKTLEQRLKNGEDVTTIFIDMGFLKMFNQAGRMVGNYAIQRVGEILETTIGEMSGEEFASRYGGDEFTALVSNPADAITFINHLEAMKTGKPIPRTEQSTLLYKPEDLMFNYGVANRAMAEEVMDVLIAQKLIREDQAVKGSDAYYNKLAEVLTRLADAGVEEHKSQSRMRFLLERVRKDFPETIPETLNLSQKQTELLVNASQKAVYGLTLSDIHRVAYDPAYNPLTFEGMEKIDALLEQEKAKMEVASGIEKEEQSHIIESFLLESKWRRQVTNLRGQIAVLQSEHQKDEALIASLQQKLDQATAQHREELQKIQMLRGQIGATGE